MRSHPKRHFGRRPASKLCKYCYEQIHAAAKRCPHCASNQRGINLTGSDIGAIVSATTALITVIGLGFPALEKAWAPPYADLKVSILNNHGPMGAEGNLVINIKNVGSQPAYIWGMGVSVKQNRKDGFYLSNHYNSSMKIDSFDSPPVSILKVPEYSNVTIFTTLKDAKPLLVDQIDPKCSVGTLFYGGKPEWGFEAGSVNTEVDCGSTIPPLLYMSFGQLENMLRQTGQIPMADKIHLEEVQYRRKFPQIVAQQERESQPMPTFPQAGKPDNASR